MVNLRCTQKLLKRLPARLFDVSQPHPSATPSSPVLSTTVLGDWYLTILIVRPRHLVLGISEQSRLCLILPAKELKTLPQRLPAYLAAGLSQLGIAPAQIEREVEAMQQWRFTPTTEGKDYRRVLGTQKEFVFLVQDLIWQSEDNPWMLSHAPNRMLWGPEPYHVPYETTLQLFALSHAASTGAISEIP